MKIRNGFVSNSSTTSFCIYGTQIEGSQMDILRMIKNTNPDHFEKCLTTLEESSYMKDIVPDLRNDTWDNIDIDSYGRDDIIGFFIPLSIHVSPDDDIFSIGRAWQNIADDETGKMFKDSTVKILKDIIGKNINDCRTIEESYN